MKQTTHEELRALILRTDWERIEEARDRVLAPHVTGLVSLYDELDAWPQRIAVVQLLQDQDGTDDLRRIMLDVLRAPDVHDWFQDTIEMTKAVALGFVEERFDTFMAFYTDRQRLREAVAEVLEAQDLTQEPMAAPPAAKPAPKATTIEDAIVSGDMESLRAFIAAGEDLDAPRDHGHIGGMPALILALSHDRLDIFEALLEAGADPNVERDGGQTALSWAVFKGMSALAVRLMDLGGDVTQQDCYGSTLTHKAAEYGYDAILEELITRGAPINAPLSDGRTPLWFACASGKNKAASRLLEAGLDVNALISGSAPLHLAARHNASRLMTTLLKAGAIVDLRDDSGHTALMIAARRGLPTLVKKLIKAGADASLTNPEGVSAADLATGKRAEQIQELLS